MDEHFRADIEAVGRIPSISSILKVVCDATGMGFAAVARVTEDRWIACEVLDRVEFGLGAGEELKVETTLCREVRSDRAEIVIDNVAEDPVYANHHTCRIYGLQSYISVPITLADGSIFGTLCAISAAPAKLQTPAVVGMFRLFAELIGHHLDSARKLAESRSELLDERATADLREQFIAVLGHDLRNPLAALAAGARQLNQTPLDDRARTIVGLMQDSVGRMTRLVDNILDLARGRLGGGIVLQTTTDEQVGSVIEQAVGELRAAHADRQIIVEVGDIGRLAYDHVRIGQLVSNLVGNALTHGARDAPVRVEARVEGDHFMVSVANAGEPIPAGKIDELFKPFFRSQEKAGHQGLGLGLYIASQIAKAHGGTLTATSTPEETRFTFRMPRQRAN